MKNRTRNVGPVSVGPLAEQAARRPIARSRTVSARREREVHEVMPPRSKGGEPNLNRVSGSRDRGGASSKPPGSLRRGEGGGWRLAKQSLAAMRVGSPKLRASRRRVGDPKLEKIVALLVLGGLNRTSKLPPGIRHLCGVVRLARQSFAAGEERCAADPHVFALEQQFLSHWSESLRLTSGSCTVAAVQ